MTANYAWLPELVTLDEAGGDWPEYVERIYAWFYNDFIASQPSFEGRRCVCKRHPQIQGKAASFWHVISEGKIEADRLPDLRRCERIRWPRPVVERWPDSEVAIWRSKRRDDDRIAIALDDFSYVVILADRGSYVILWTAYCVEHENRRAKLRKEYERYVAGNSWGRPEGRPRYSFHTVVDEILLAESNMVPNDSERNRKSRAGLPRLAASAEAVTAREGTSAADIVSNTRFGAVIRRGSLIEPCSKVTATHSTPRCGCVARSS